MQRNVVFIFALVVILQNATEAQTENLFNGKDLSGWTVYGTEKWYVEELFLGKRCKSLFRTIQQYNRTIRQY